MKDMKLIMEGWREYNSVDEQCDEMMNFILEHYSGDMLTESVMDNLRSLKKKLGPKLFVLAFAANLILTPGIASAADEAGVDLPVAAQQMDPGLANKIMNTEAGEAVQDVLNKIKDVDIGSKITDLLKKKSVDEPAAEDAASHDADFKEWSTLLKEFGVTSWGHNGGIHGWPYQLLERGANPEQVHRLLGKTIKRSGGEMPEFVQAAADAGKFDKNAAAKLIKPTWGGTKGLP